MKPRRFSITHRFAQRWFCGTVWILAGLWSAAVGEESGEPWQAPCSVIAGPKSDTLYALCARSRRLLVVSEGAVSWSLVLDAEPTGLAAALESPLLWVTSAGSEGVVEAIDNQTGNRVARWLAGHGACSPVIGTKTGRLYVCNRFDGEVQAFASDTGRELGRVRVSREPIAAALTPDEKLLVVANHLPTGRSDVRFVACEVTIIDTQNLSVRTNVSLVNGGVLDRGVAVSPDGRWAAITHNLARFQVPTTQVEHGWMNDSALALVDLTTFQLRATLLLDEPQKGAANPAAVAWTEDSRRLIIVHSGTHELSVIEIQAVLDRILATKPGHFVSDLAFLKDTRKRIPLRGNGARSLAVRGGSMWVAGYFSDTIEEVFLDGVEPGRLISLGGGAERNVTGLGERLFNDATIGQRSWQSCASCHPDGRVDGLNWDLLNDGIGNPKNTRSLLLSHQTGPAMSLGVRASAETAVRAGFRHILFTRRPEEELTAVDRYLDSMRPFPSPHLVSGDLSEAARRGKGVYEKAGCASCHPEPLFTDRKRYDVGTANRSDGTKRAFDTPTLVEVWRTAPYLHDGSAATLEDVFRMNRDDQHGKTSPLSQSQLDDLLAYVLSL